MGAKWEIPSEDEQDIYIVLDEENQYSEPSLKSSYLGRNITIDRDTLFMDYGHVEISAPNVKFDNVLGTHEASTGFLTAFEEDEQTFLLTSDRGVNFFGKFVGRPRRSLNIDSKVNRATFVSNDLLKEGHYFIKKVKVEFRRDPNIDSWRIPIQLPILRLHRPHHPGCTSKMNIAITQKVDASVQYEFIGIKGGGGEGFTIKQPKEFNAGTICKEITVPASLIVDHGATLVNGEPVVYGSRYRIVDVQPHIQETREIPPEVDRCETPPIIDELSKSANWDIFDKTKIPSGKVDSDKEAYKFGSTGFVSVGVGADIGSAPFKLSVDVRRTVEIEWEVTTTLMGGAKYLRYPIGNYDEGGPFEICWSVLG